MKSILALLFVLIGAGTTAVKAAGVPHAVQVPPGGHDLLFPNEEGGVRPSVPKEPGIAGVEVMRVADAPWEQYWRFDIKKAPANSWSVQLSAKVSGGITRGDKCLLMFYARAVDGKAFGSAHVEVQNPPSYSKLGGTQFRVGTQWHPVILPFVADQDGPQGKCAVSIHLGSEVQKVDVGGLRLLSYGTTFPEDKLPRPYYTYEGREADASWRKDAKERIEKLRKGDFTLVMVDEDGKPMANTEVRAELKRHAFGFGSAVTAKLLNDPSADGERYRAIVDECFSRVVFENDFKPGPWEAAKDPNTKGAYRKAWLDQSLAWLADRHFSVRGHYLCWGPFEDWSEKLRNNPQAIREKVIKWIEEITPAMAGHVSEWDALNHPAGWEAGMCIDRVLGNAFYSEVFRKARTLTTLPLWINEDQVFRPGRQQEEYYEIIKRLLAEGTRIDGIGNQAHLHSSFLPSPMEMLANSDRFAELVPALQITEFDVGTEGDEELAADFTRDALITTFSHPAYTGFVLWGFWEGAHWIPETALWRKDWSEKPAARVWRDLVCKEWRTDATGKTDVAGRFKLRGFYGRYEITVKPRGAVQTATVLLDKGQSGKDGVTVISSAAPGGLR
ncbi:endo-1,4-beta-xylanase [Verrucomicrobium sp. BvORR106]|uniref:endo-1,4-beta-xylanase n=1 Tax=Verrucomicrobium sp. BvORR106 TaxID=1403819 RepID=UPI00056E72EC|nr:endo-1,4-beta-xylanase [Verrucomicrobium sp. BvORR106]